MRLFVTGGSGALGSALIRRVVRDSLAERVVCYSRGEHAQVRLAESLNLNMRGDGSIVRFFIGDVRDHHRLKLAMRGITHVVHAAALKVVPIGEYNPTEFTKTNVQGTANVIEAAIESGVEQVVTISSDKSCAPVNLYGATKLCAEKLSIAANAYSGMGTKFSVVRYGNVTGSTGSVVPKWWALARDGKPLPVTQPEMTRFWITVDQAVDLVLRVLRDSQGGEVFIPKLPAYRLHELAFAVWAQATGDWGYACEYVGARHGEKGHESMVSADEAPWCYELPDGMTYAITSSPKPDWTKVGKGFSYSSDQGSTMTVMQLMTELAALGWHHTTM